MADGRHLEKSKTAISPLRFDRAADNLAWWRISVIRRERAVKISNFLKSKMADGRHLKIEKRPFLGNGSTDLHKIWHGDAYWPSERYGQLKFPTFKNPRWRTAAILKVEKRPYLLNGLTDLHNLAWWRISVIRRVWAVNISNF